ncbi:glycosyltransferase [Acinetobacter schindleri]|uniref:Glycosyl transferase family 1 domain-containing protein n=1 Tax=Acinetobacter schindleri CIP 107287 TaxID=1217988 RepID=N9AGJ6_9GAMM|nr:glycosyltransferase [Acinetobacter schindleri]ENV43183.1 hypothetical protein F955_02926 [Acinetobacter schindleri CIP 107287]
MNCKPKNYLFVSPTAVLGGAERVMFNIILTLLDNGNYVTLYIMSRGEQSGWDLIKNHPNFNLIIKKYNSEKTSLPMLLFSLFYLSHTRKYDFGFSTHSHVNGIMSLMRKLKLLKVDFLISRESTVVFERYYGVWKIIFKLIYRFMYGSQDLVICQTERMKVSLINNLGYKPAKKIKVVPNPINISYIETQLLNNKNLVKPFNTLIVGCGRLISLKKFDYLIEAFASISSVFPEVGLVIIGDGPEKSKLIALVDSLDIKDKVIFTGKISNPIQWFAQAEIGVVSSELEGFPNVLIEMMASGIKQIITTPCSDGVNEIPNIDVTDSCSINDIKESINKSLINPIDYSFEYKDYVYNKRSTDNFLNKVEVLLKE